MRFIYKIFVVLVFGQVCASGTSDTNTKPIEVVVNADNKASDGTLDPTITVGGGEPYHVRGEKENHSLASSFASGHISDYSSLGASVWSSVYGHADKKIKLTDTDKKNWIILSVTNTIGITRGANEIKVEKVNLIPNATPEQKKSLGRALTCFVEAYTSRVDNFQPGDSFAMDYLIQLVYDEFLGGQLKKSIDAKVNKHNNEIDELNQKTRRQRALDWQNPYKPDPWIRRKSLQEVLLEKNLKTKNNGHLYAMLHNLYNKIFFNQKGRNSPIADDTDIKAGIHEYLDEYISAKNLKQVSSQTS